MGSEGVIAFFNIGIFIELGLILCILLEKKCNSKKQEE